jgi:hypothetical protein
VLHEGLIGVIGEEGLQEIDYSDVEDTPVISVTKATAGWMGITDKYWAAALIPPQGSGFETRFAHFTDGRARYQSDFKSDAMAIAPGGSATSTTLVFAGAKEVPIIEGYQDQYNILNFELLIDWGWFYFLTKPMFWPSNGSLASSAISALRSCHHGGDQAGLPPAGQQVLRVDVEDEEGPAEAEGNPGPLQGRQAGTAEGHDGALQEREDQSGGRLLAGADPDPGVLRAL